MMRPNLDFDEFAKLAEKYSVIPLAIELLGDLETPVSAYQKLRTDRSFLLESVEHGLQWGRFSFLGRDPEFVLMFTNGVVSVEGHCPVAVEGRSDPLGAVDEILAAFDSPNLAGLPPLHSGLVGYWGYPTVRFMERVPDTKPDVLGVPEMLLFGTGTMVVFDHFRQTIIVIRNVYVTDSDEETLRRQYGVALDKLDEVRDDLSAARQYRPIEVSIPDDIGTVESNMSSDEFKAMVERGREYIYAGDIFQVVLSQRFSRELRADPFDVQRALRIVNPSPYMTFIEHPEVTIACASPEELVRVSQHRVLTRPIAGTRWRGSSDEEDAELAADLLADPKERAEHVMLVDLARNDLGRVGEYGSVNVDDFMVVERYSHVMHIVSTVTCRSRPGVRPMDVIRATFPAGTVSGAPKVRAMEIIDELEPVNRGPYAGVVGYVDYRGNLDTALTLRTAVIRDGVAHVQAGGGIVADSDPDYELDESRNKARGVLVAIEAAERTFLDPQ